MKKRLALVLVGLFAAAFCLSRGAEAMTISPPFVDFSLNPGDTVVDTLKIYNEQPNAITVYPILQNFEAGTEELGEPVFYDAKENRNGQALAPWITVDPAPITLEPQQRFSLPFTINIPKENAQPGGHYGALILSTTPPDQQGGAIGLHPEIGELILVRVSGDVKEIGGIAEFGFSKPKVWYNYKPVDFFLRFENNGNTHLRPVGNLFITNMFGRQVTSIEVNDGFKSVMPHSIRRFNFTWGDKPSDTATELNKEWSGFGFGKYKAQLALNYGQTTNQIVTEERVFYIWPWRLMLIGGGGLVILLALLWL
ncbi:MAG: hypothetical protein PHT12_06350, partial [Patescibacteria group bacterium]|nr:hypothetical protein [Patescibacteria group bacterium]